jgi:hypothetical protein
LARRVGRPFPRPLPIPIVSPLFAEPTARQVFRRVAHTGLGFSSQTVTSAKAGTASQEERTDLATHSMLVSSLQVPPLTIKRQLTQVRWPSAVVLFLALSAVFLLAIGTPYWHHDTPGSEATCSLCHVAHMPILVGVVVSVPLTPKFVAWVDPARVEVAHTADAVLDFPPRAPPA